MGLRYAGAALALLLGLGGCAGTQVSQFAAGQPSIAPPDWMVGTTDGYGLVTDRFGRIKTQFHAHEIGSWNPATRTLTLVEHITYPADNTPPDDRTWHFVEVTPGHWAGTANDVIGTATGTQAGNAWHLRFHQLLTVGGAKLEVAVDDWRLREAADVAVDHSTISKLGIQLATAEIAFVKRAAPAQ